MDHFNSTKLNASLKFLSITSLLFMFFSIPSASALPIDLGVAGQYNTFIFKDFDSQGSDTEGRLAVGGDASLQSYRIGEQLDLATGGNVVVVGGDLNFTDGEIVNGNAVVGGSADLVRTNVQGTLSESGPIPIDFATEQLFLTNLSSDLALLGSNGTSLTQSGDRLSGVTGSDLVVFDLDGSVLLGSSWLNFDVNSIDDNATILFNVSGTNAGLTNMGMQALDSISSNVLFNFYQAESLQLFGVDIRGSILAPLADVQAPHGVINGTIIAESWSGNMQQNHNPFTPYTPAVPPSAVPEPSAIFLLFLGLVGFLVVRKKALNTNSSI